VQIKGVWKSEWLDHPHEALVLAQKLEKEKIYDEEKLVLLTQNYVRQDTEKRARKEAKRLLQERQEIERPAEESVEEEAKRVILWN
jgi:hypothetical protein